MPESRRESLIGKSVWAGHGNQSAACQRATGGAFWAGLCGRGRSIHPERLQAELRMSREGGATAFTACNIEQSHRRSWEAGPQAWDGVVGRREAWHGEPLALEGRRLCAHAGSLQALGGASSFLQRGVHRQKTSVHRQDGVQGGRAPLITNSEVVRGNDDTQCSFV
ncbi:hypothetical protein NDU88_007924 [Pleurodeles waltl]|uniref:Uncharacterized protein n=1 Tax=Pleurodeles waltl TaxID=8319 RepID=A0AAV7RQU8_PLEWA|nr:hypothetical protein NDU88_007924 [Pleurodeles waltl]